MDLKITDVADLDCIYLSYDEPQKEEFWLQIQNIVPWAKRVDNVKGSDAAHKACADASDTNFFVLIDGDNIPDPEFFNLQIEIICFFFKTSNLNNLNLLCLKGIFFFEEIIFLVVITTFWFLFNSSLDKLIPS